MKIQPQNNRILIIPIDDEIDDVIVRGPDQKVISIPETAKPHYVKVIEVAPNVTVCKPGDTVITIPNPNVCIVDFHKGLGLIHENTVLATFTNEQPLVQS